MCCRKKGYLENFQDNSFLCLPYFPDNSVCGIRKHLLHVPHQHRSRNYCSKRVEAPCDHHLLQEHYFVLENLFHGSQICKKSIDLEEFCEEYPLICGEYNKLTVTVPKEDYVFSDTAESYLFKDSYNDKTLFNFTSKVKSCIEDVDESRLHLKCYSENLQLYQSRSKAKTLENDELIKQAADWAYKSPKGAFLFEEFIYPMNIEPFYPPDKPQVFFAVHSPYVPLNPLVDLEPVLKGVHYFIGVQLEKEEHLLPPPYQTKCRDNAPSNDAKDFTNPSSYQICLEMCKSEYNKEIFGCGWGMTMMLSKREMCLRGHRIPTLSKEQEDGLEKKHLICTKNCKQECLKLHYKNHVYERVDEDEDSLGSWITVYTTSHEVTILKHVPLYGSGEIFSHIGGLLGCWLGISIFTFTDIMEKFYRKVIRWKKRIKNAKVKRAPTSDVHID